MKTISKPKTSSVRKLTCLAALWIALLAVTPLLAAREYGGQFTAERLTAARANCQKYDWAARVRDDAVAKAKPWAEIADADLWAMVPGQDLPRCIDVTYERDAKPQRLGCLVCGAKLLAYGNYPYDPDFRNKPWKLTCPSCGATFPTNDFGKYYASGIDAHGLFNPAQANRELLFNADHPDPKDPLHTYGVDDGFGYVDAAGHAHKFIAYYAWKDWRYLQDGLNALADAFVHTGDRVYAHKAAVLLDRIADVYPAMDWKPYADRGWFHSDGFSRRGKIEGSIWECAQVTAIAEAYDKILSGTVNDDALFAFLEERGQKFQLPTPKGTRDQFVKNVDDNLLACAFQAVLDGRIHGNEGMHQHTAVACAIALNTQPQTSQWLDWVFSANGGRMPQLIVGQLDRDGLSPEGAPNYATLWDSNFAALAMAIADYPAYTRHNIFADFPQFAATFTAPYRLTVLGRATPNTGDSGATGLITRLGVNAKLMAAGYQYTHQPDLAVAAWRANGQSVRGLDHDVCATDPAALADEIEAIGKSAGPRPVAGELLSGFGQATLESPVNGGTALTAYYGRTVHHGHTDRLNFDLFAFGRWLAPDLGYPEFTGNWPSLLAWTNQTLSHNTVVVDGKPQARDYGGRTELFAQTPDVSIFRLDGGKVYPQCDRYARTMMLVNAPGSHAYAVDVFESTGGSDHLYSFHGPPGDVKAEGNWTDRPGTYAGPDVPLAAAPGDFPLGFSYLAHVRERDTAASPFTIDWHVGPAYRPAPDASPDDHLRIHVLSPLTTATLADGQPPQNKPGNPKWITYALLRRTGEKGLASTFVSVIEPYRQTPFVREVRRLDGGAADTQHVAMQVDLIDGTTDVLLLNLSAASQSAGGVILEGAGSLGMVRVTPGHAPVGTLVNGTRLEAPGVSLSATPLVGRVTAMNKDLAGGGWMDVDTPLPADGSLNGRYVCVNGVNERDPCYRIDHVTGRAGGGTRLDCGPISFIRGYSATATRPALGGDPYLYDFAVGDRFFIPTIRTTTQPGPATRPF